jgi:hypothetical protein
MQHQHNASPTCLVPNPKNSRVLVTQQAAQKIREELEAASKAAPVGRPPQKQAYVAPPPKTGQSAKPKFSAPPVLLRRGSAPPPLVQTTDTSTAAHSAQKPAQAPKPEATAVVPQRVQERGPVAIVPPPAAPAAPAARPAAAKNDPPARIAKQTATPARAPNPKTKKRTPALAQNSKGGGDPEDSSVAIAPPARDDNIPGDIDGIPPKSAAFDEDLFAALLNE